MANSLMSILSGFGSGNNNIFMQAVGAMMRGESPQQFMQNLARSNPALQGLDLTNINATAQKVCQEHGVDAGKLTEEIKQSIGNMK